MAQTKGPAHELLLGEASANTPYIWKSALAMDCWLGEATANTPDGKVPWSWIVGGGSQAECQRLI